jgi:signal transduction histidine kinase
MQAQLYQSDKLASIGQLAGGVAHEINNPLQVILGYSRLVTKTLREDDPLYVPLTSILREALRCKNLVVDLLTFARVIKPAPENVNINEVIDQTISLITALTKITNIEVKKNYAPDINPVSVNKNQIQQVIVNLCNNAVDAMPSGGTLTITTLNSGRTVRVVIRDTGPGMTAEIKQHIFEPFFTTKEVGMGTGLGLSLSYEIMQRHKGSIAVESEPGRGTQFTLTLPAV